MDDRSSAPSSSSPLLLDGYRDTEARRTFISPGIRFYQWKCWINSWNLNQLSFIETKNEFPSNLDVSRDLFLKKTPINILQLISRLFGFNGHSAASAIKNEMLRWNCRLRIGIKTAAILLPATSEDKLKERERKKKSPGNLLVCPMIISFGLPPAPAGCCVNKWTKPAAQLKFIACEQAKKQIAQGFFFL